MPTVEYAVCITAIHLFIGMSGFTVQSAIVYGVNLFAMPGMLEYIQIVESLFSPSHQGPARKPEAYGAGSYYFHFINDLNAEKNPSPAVT